MLGAFKFFDTYNLKARVFPALIAGAPTLAFLFVLIPWDHIGLSHITATAVGVILLFALADIGRRTGKRVEAKLGTGRTPEQWHRGNPEIAEAAKDRYRAFMEKQLNLVAPTAKEEQENPSKANDFYLSVGNWLREHTRDTRKFPILFNENITYGFRRNLLGLRPTAFVFNAVLFVACVAILYYKRTYFVSFPHTDEKLVIIITAVIFHAVYMFFVVNESSVREASKIYGRQLVLSCEAMVQKTSSHENS